MKTTFLFLATLVTAHIHGAQPELTPDTKVTAVLKDMLTGEELVKITDMYYREAEQVMPQIAREGYNSSIGVMMYDPTTHTATFTTIVGGQAFLDALSRRK